MEISLTNIPLDRIPSVTRLLQEVGLPTDDLPEGLPHFIAAFDDSKLVGVAGVELYNTVGLLRSVAVSPDYQQQHIGSMLVLGIERQVTVLGIETLYLITTTAEEYFAGKGFRRVDRGTVPEEIANTQQFSVLCPSSSVVMRKNLS